MNSTAIRFRHHHLNNGNVLTVCSELHYGIRTVDVGWSMFNANDDRWIRKVGNEIALSRLGNLSFILADGEPIVCDYISFRSLVVILAASNTPSKYDPTNLLPIDEMPSEFPLESKVAIQDEIIEMLSLFGQRLGLPAIEYI